MTILLLSSLAGGLLTPGNAYAFTSYDQRFEAPYGYRDTSTWENELALGWADAASNNNTGFIAASAFSYAGGASAQSEQWIYIDAPSGQTSQVSVDASIIYVGGTQKFGLGGSSWGGVDKIWYVGDEYHRETLDPVFGYDDIGSAAVDLALVFVPAGLELAGISESARIAKLVQALDYINSAYQIASGFAELLNAGEAQRVRTSFDFYTDQPIWIGVGLRVDTSGCVLGACDATVLGYVENIDVHVTSRQNYGHWSFDGWYGGTIGDDTGNLHYGTAYNGPTQVSGKPGIPGFGIRFDGVNDWASLNFSTEERDKLTRDGTFELWVKPEEMRDAMLIYGGSGSSANGGGPDKEINLCTESTGYFTFYIGSYNDNGRDMYMNLGPYVPNQWYHLAVSYSNNNYWPECSVEAYVNGQRVNNPVLSAGNSLIRANVSMEDIRLGRPNANERYFKGVMDDVRIYNWRLSEDDIQAHFWQAFDSTPPGEPWMVAEPDYSPGDGNMVACDPAWDTESGIGAYKFRCLDGETVVEESTWIKSSSWLEGARWTFDGLAEGTEYTYQAKAINRAGIEGNWSSPAMSTLSTQDASPPEIDSFDTGEYLSGVIDGDRVLVDLSNLSATEYPAGSASGIARYIVSHDGESWQSYDLPEPYSDTINDPIEAEIPFRQGTYFFWVKVVDAVGQESEAVMDYGFFDYDPPAGTITINDGAEFTDSDLVTLTISIGDNVSGFCGDDMRFSNDGETWSDWEDFSSTIRDDAWQLSSGYGEKTVYLQLQDCAGNISTAYSDTIGYGPTPTGEIIINNNATWSQSLVRLSLTATDATEMAIWNDDPDYTPGYWDWYPYASSYLWRLDSPGDGEKTVYVKFRSDLGVESDTYSDSIKMDCTRPAGSILTNGESSTRSNSREVTLSLSATDNYSGVAWMCFSHDGANWTPWEKYQETRSWSFTTGEGMKEVWVKFKDRAGNESDRYFNQVLLDLCPPAGTLEINNGDEYTGNPSVTLNASIEHISGEQGGEGYNMPEQFSSTQGDISWYYYRSTAPGDYVELCWDNTVSPWGEMDHYSWNAQVGEDDPQYLQVTSLEDKAVLVPGDGANIAIGWQQDHRASVMIKGELWAADPDGGSPSGDDDGVYLSIYHNDDLIAGPVQVFHNADLHHGTLEMTLAGPDHWVEAGDMIYFYVDRGTSQDNDTMYYNFSIISMTENWCYVRFANLAPENIDCLTKYQIRNGSSLLWDKVLRDVEWIDWQSCNLDRQEDDWLLAPGDGTKVVLAQFKDWVGNISYPQIATITLDQTSPATGCSTPFDGATDVYVNPNLNSTAAYDNTPPVYHKFRIANNIDFTPILEESDWQTGTSWAPSTTLDCSTDYWWQVKAKDSISPPNESDWSAAFGFTTGGTAYHTLIVTWDPAEGGSVILNPHQPTGAYEIGTNVEATAISEDGYAFVSWSGDLTGNNNPDTATMDSNKSATAKFIVFNAPTDVRLSGVDPGVESIDVTPVSLGGIDTSNMPNGREAENAYVVDPTGAGNFTLRFTDVPNAGDIEVYKIVDATWVSIPVIVIDATTIEITMDASDPTIVFTLPETAPPSPTQGGSGGGGTPTHHLRVDLLGTTKSTQISNNGKILETLEVTSMDGILTINIPKGIIAKSEDGKLLCSLEVQSNENPPQTPQGIRIIGDTYSITPDGAIFTPSISLTVTYDPNVLSRDADEKYLFIAYYNKSLNEWVEIESLVDLANHTVCGTVCHCTDFAILVSEPASDTTTEPSEVTINGLSISPATVSVGEEVTISSLVTNDGQLTCTYDVVLKINNELEDTEIVTVAAGTSREVIFSVSRDSAGTYLVNVNGISGSFTVQKEAINQPDGSPEPMTPATTSQTKGIDWRILGPVIGVAVFLGTFLPSTLRKRKKQ